PSKTSEIYDLRNAGPGWSAPVTAPFVPPLYPRMAVMPNGVVFYTGQGSGTNNTNSWTFNPAVSTWTMGPATTVNRSYGSCALLPLLPPSYTPRVMSFGGGNPATPSTEIIDLSSASPVWAPGPNMSTGRMHMNAVILPDGRVLAEGGSVNGGVNVAGKTADPYHPPSHTLSPPRTAPHPPLLHPGSLPPSDSTPLRIGSNPPPPGHAHP